MKQRSFFMIVTAFVLLAGCSSEKNTMPEEMPADFGFRVSYGINGANKIDTFNDLVVKDLVEDGIAEANIALSEQEMEAIYLKMAEFNVMGKLDLEEDEQCLEEPSSRTAWEISANGEVKEYGFGSYCDGYPEDVQKLMALEEVVHQIVSSKEAYKALPEANGAYE